MHDSFGILPEMIAESRSESDLFSHFSEFTDRHNACNLMELQSRGFVMDLSIWLPATFGLGLVTLLILLAFVEACDRV